MSFEAEWVVDHRADADTRTAVAALREIDALLGPGGSGVSPDGADADLARRGAVKARLASFLSWGTGDVTAAAAAAEEAVALHQRAGEPRLARLAALELAYARGLAGDVRVGDTGVRGHVRVADLIDISHRGAAPPAPPS